MVEVGEEFSVEIDGELEDFVALGEVEDQGIDYFIAEDGYGELFVFVLDDEELELVEDEEIQETVTELYLSDHRPSMSGASNLWDDDDDYFAETAESDDEDNFDENGFKITDSDDDDETLS